MNYLTDSIPFIRQRLALAIMLLGLCALKAPAQNVRVAIAANLQPVMKALQQDFKKQSGITVEAVSGSSGNLAAQIKNAAPFDVFLSADTEFPEALFKTGFATKKPAVYASGVLILFSKGKLGSISWQKLLQTKGIRHIAIGNPAIAPYGKAAKEALTHEGLYDLLKPKIVFGESITQVNTYLTTGVAEAGFTTLSFVKDPNNKSGKNYQTIDPKTYRSIQQGMVLIKHQKANPGADKFYRYILGAGAKKIFTRFGYHVQ